MTRSLNKIEVSVADSGSGTQSAEITHIFDRFFQADPARKGGKKNDTGLDLAIVKEIVQAHGGTIIVHSAGRRLHVHNQAPAHPTVG